MVGCRDPPQFEKARDFPIRQVGAFPYRAAPTRPFFFPVEFLKWVFINGNLPTAQSGLLVRISMELLFRREDNGHAADVHVDFIFHKHSIRYAMEGSSY